MARNIEFSCCFWVLAQTLASFWWKGGREILIMLGFVNRTSIQCIYATKRLGKAGRDLRRANFSFCHMVRSHDVDQLTLLTWPGQYWLTHPIVQPYWPGVNVKTTLDLSSTLHSPMGPHALHMDCNSGVPLEHQWLSVRTAQVVWILSPHNKFPFLENATVPHKDRIMGSVKTQHILLL